MNVTITQRRYDVRINQRVIQPVVVRHKIKIVTVAKQGPPGTARIDDFGLDLSLLYQASKL